MRIHVFDFDGTLTTRDTLLVFISHARGWWALVWALLLYSPLLVAMKLHLVDNGRVKESLFGHFFRGMSERDFDALCEDFARQYPHIFRAEGLKTIERALNNGDRVVVISASIDRWVRPCLDQFMVHRDEFIVIGTEIEVVDGLLTGRFATPNCYGPEKLHRLKEWLRSPLGPKGRFFERSESEERVEESGSQGVEEPHIIAYGDSRGDKELLAYANERYYKPFR